MDNNESPELIEQEMEQTRASLTRKVSALENQVVGTIHDATETVSDTVESVSSTVKDTLSSVKDTVSESVSEVSERVKSMLDLSQHTRDYPWAMVGGAAAVGFLTGILVFRKESLGYSEQGLEWNPPPQPSSRISQPEPAATPSEPSWLDKLLDRAGNEARTLGETFIASASTSIKQALQDQMPRLIDTGINLITEKVNQPEPAAGAYPYPPPGAGRVC